MSTFKILIQGYAIKKPDGWLASSTTVLIQDSGKNILVDPGINKSLLLAQLEASGLNIADIDIIFMTHYHPDHNLLTALFDHAQILDGGTIYSQDKESEYSDTIPGTNLKVIPTPGHAHEHASIIFTHKTKGTVAVAADLFWWTDDEKQKTEDPQILINRDDPFTTDRQALIRSRKKVLAIADYIIPGHGHIFKNPAK